MFVYVDEKFSAAHFLPGYDGPCSRMHGHTWRAEIWVSGDIDKATGMVVDFKDVKDVVRSLDHTLLNDRFAVPTAENIAAWLLGAIPNAFRVRLWESDKTYVEARA